MQTKLQLAAVRLRRIFALGLVLVLGAAGCGEHKEAAAGNDAKAPLTQLPDDLSKAIESMGSSDYDAARDALAKVDRGKLIPAHHALADRIDSQLHSVAGEYGPALESLDRAIASHNLPPDEELIARYDKGWLLAQLGEPAKAVEVYRAWQQSLKGPAPATQLLTVSEAYAAAHDCKGAADLIADAYTRITPEETVDVAAALEVARPLCPDEPGLSKYGKLGS